MFKTRCAGCQSVNKIGTGHFFCQDEREAVQEVVSQNISAKQTVYETTGKM